MCPCYTCPSLFNSSLFRFMSSSNRKKTMAAPRKLAHQSPYYVNAVGLSKENGAMKGFDNEDDAKADANDRNSRAEHMEIEARYEVRQRDA